jgi:hypothetical protein
MVSESTVSKVFAGIGIIFGISSVIAIGVGKPIPAIPLAILAFGSEYASAIHAKI